MRALAIWAMTLGAVGCAGLVERPPEHASDPMDWEGPGETPRSLAPLGGAPLDCPTVCQNHASWARDCGGDSMTQDDCLEGCSKPEQRDQWSCLEQSAKCETVAQCQAFNEG